MRIYYPLVLMQKIERIRIMKKSLVLAAIATMILAQSASFAATTPTTSEPQKNAEQTKVCPKKPPERPNFDDRLNLTQEQRQKAHELRMQGHEKIKPAFEQIKAKKEEIKKIKTSNISESKKQKKIEPLKNDLRKLKAEVRKIHEENMKQFEAILTPEQKAEFEKIKQEGRENFKKHHPKHPHDRMKGDKGCDKK